MSVPQRIRPERPRPPRPKSWAGCARWTVPSPPVDLDLNVNVKMVVVTQEVTHPATTDSRYKWIALSNITLGTLMVFINQSIVLIALPAIFRGIHMNPLTASNTGYMLWMLMGFMVVLAVMVVTLGRIGDMFGRVRMYNLGFAVFTAF